MEFIYLWVYHWLAPREKKEVQGVGVKEREREEHSGEWGGRE